MTPVNSIADLWVAALRDLAAMGRRMWPVLLQICAIYVAATMAWFTVPHLLDNLFALAIGHYFVLVGSAFATSPFYVALYRFIASGEVRWFPQKGDYKRALPFAVWAGFVLLVEFSPILLFMLVTVLSDLPQAPGLMLLFAAPVVWIRCMRLTTLLPMAALDPDRAGWSVALEQTRGRFWLHALAVSGATIPGYFAMLMLATYGAGFASTSIFSVLMITALLLGQILPLAVATRLYLLHRSSKPQNIFTARTQRPRGT